MTYTPPAGFVPSITTPSEVTTIQSPPLPISDPSVYVPATASSPQELMVPGSRIAACARATNKKEATKKIPKSPERITVCEKNDFMLLRCS